jgi:hypothetical protein
MNLTKLQKKTIKAIGRWVDGHCTHSKALVTNKQLSEMGVVEFKDDAVVLTKIGRVIYKDLGNED